jgi:hypothetical protein
MMKSFLGKRKIVGRDRNPHRIRLAGRRMALDAQISFLVENGSSVRVGEGWIMQPEVLF